MWFQPLKPSRNHLRWRAKQVVGNQLIRTDWGRRKAVRRIRERHGRQPLGSERLHPAETNLISAPAIWVWELYAPSQVGALEAWLKELGEKPERMLFGNAADVLHARRSIGFRNQGEGRGPTLITREASKRYFSVSGNLVTRLPDGVEMAWPTISVVPGGLTILTVGLFYEEQAREQLDDVLRAPRESHITPKRNGGHRELPAARVQEEAVDRLFAARTEAAQVWLQSVAPGALATYAEHRDVRALRLVTHRDESPGPDGERPTSSWFANLDLREAEHGWRSTTMPLSLSSAGRFGAQLTGIERDVRTFDVTRVPAPDPPEVNDWSTTVSGIDRRITNVVVTAAIDNLIDVYADGLGRLRDLPAHRRDSPAQVFRRLRKLRQEIQILVDARATMSALASGRMSEYLYLRMSYDGGVWQSPNGEHQQLETWLSDLPSAARSILELEEQIRERLKLESDLLSTSASVRAQRRAFRVSLLALCIAAVGIFLAAERFNQERATGHSKQREHVTIPNRPSNVR